VQWLLDGQVEEDRPALDDGIEFSAIRLVSDGILLYAQDTRGPTHTQDAFAVGSGSDFALAAMYLGATAEEAVELACELDIYCSLPVVSFKYESIDEKS
jgi:ATP-dependent protease HslVU (ClpYQ) peptidase subunit